MTLKFYTTEKIEHKEPFKSSHHTVPQKYIATILKEKIPDSELIISNSREIIDILSEASLKSDEEWKKELELFEEAKIKVEKKFYLENIREDQSRPIHQRFYNDKESEITQWIYSQKWGSNHFYFKSSLASWAKDPQDILSKLEEGEKDIKTDIAGIIVPIAHADHAEVSGILDNIKGRFSMNLERKTQKKDEYETKEGVQGGYFFKKFGIPIFNSPDFAQDTDTSIQKMKHIMIG